MRACRFSSVASGSRPSKTGSNVLSMALKTPSIGSDIDQLGRPIRLTPQMALTTAGIVQPFTEDAGHVEVDDEQLLFKGSALGQQLAARVVHQARAVEDQLVLTADHVYVGD